MEKLNDSAKRATRLGIVGVSVVVSVLTWLGAHFGVKHLLAGSVAVMFALRLVRTHEIRSMVSLVFGMCAGMVIILDRLHSPDGGSAAERR